MQRISADYLCGKRGESNPFLSASSAQFAVYSPFAEKWHRCRKTGADVRAVVCAVFRAVIHAELRAVSRADGCAEKTSVGADRVADFGANVGAESGVKSATMAHRVKIISE